MRRAYLMAGQRLVLVVDIAGPRDVICLSMPRRKDRWFPVDLHFLTQCGIKPEPLVEVERFVHAASTSALAADLFVQEGTRPDRNAFRRYVLLERRSRLAQTA